MRRFAYLSFVLFLSGCLANNALTYDSVATTNNYHLARVRKGMSERQVLEIMHKPYSYESFEMQDDIYDVWFYVTRPSVLGQTRMVSQNLTPLTFKNGILVGTGYNWYYYIMKEEALGLKPQAPIPASKPEVKKDIEDKTFEKALKGVKAPIKDTKTLAPLEPPAPLDKPAMKKAPPPQHKVNKTQKDQKLPPNVHIISDAPLIEKPSCTGPCDEVPEHPKVDLPCSKDRFSVLERGMSESQVYRVFGEPQSYESFTYGSDAYDVWFYETTPSKNGQPSLVPQPMTILLFKNAILMSRNEEDFFKLKQEIESSHQNIESLPAPTHQRHPQSG